MELKELTERVSNLFSINDLEDLGATILKIVMNNDTTAYDSFINLIDGDLGIDWLQKVYQYYLADREDKKQDYTPKSLAKLVSYLTKTADERVCMDLCAGTGALTIQKWNTNKRLKFICRELDEKVVPFLLFNLAIRNIEGVVLCGDVFANPKIIYKLSRSDKYSSVEVIQEAEMKADICISNPPFNVPWNQTKNFMEYSLPPKGNGNFAFVLEGFENSSVAAYILPCGIMSTSNKEEVQVRNELLAKGKIKAIITLPGKMFESTDIPVCVLVLGNDCNKVRMIDLRKKCVQEEREQRGQYGSKSHTKRIYKKTINVIPDNIIEDVVLQIQREDSIPGYAISVPVDKAIAESNITPSRYIEFQENTESFRSIDDIVSNINMIRKQKNLMKLTVNQTIARDLLGIDMELYKSNDNCDLETELIDKLGLDIIKDDYLTFSKKAGEFKLENKNKKELSSLTMQYFNQWKANIVLLNTMENTFLVELRDALLPKLMSGEISL